MQPQNVLLFCGSRIISKERRNNLRGHAEKSASYLGSCRAVDHYHVKRRVLIFGLGDTGNEFTSRLTLNSTCMD